MNEYKNETIVGTDIEEVKHNNANSGLTYNEVKALLAKRGGANTNMYSHTNIDQVQKQNTASEQKKH